MKKRDIEERAFAFACRVLRMEQRLQGNPRIKRRSWNQLTDSSTSVGANLEEARGAHSRADFHAKMRIALKEARESKFWLRVIADSSGLPSTRFASLISEAGEIIAILTTIARKTNPNG